ncbi:hypothetical protein [Absidia glauca]|uniref:Uncharacterized protein n=1 Tax=Absidia glauca TaxID=4829 RepID=A0A163J5Q9_ABSGL|nr:hypothetical protein [Absidia glauca]
MNPSTPSFYAILHTPPLLHASSPPLVSFLQSTFQPSHSTHHTTTDIYKVKTQELAHYLQQQHCHVNPQSLQLLFKILLQEETKLTLAVDHSFTQVIINYLMNRMEQLDQDPSYAWVLGFLDEECLDALQHEDKLKLLGLCFKLRSTIGYDDLEHYHALYNLQKDLHLPSCAWEDQILVNCQEKQSIRQLDSIFDQVLAMPFATTVTRMTAMWTQMLPDNKKPLPPSIQTRLKLYGATYPVEMKGFHQSLTSKGYCLPQILSPTLTDALGRIALSPLPLEVSHMISDRVQALLVDVEGARISLDAVLLENIRSDVHNQVGDEGVLKECALMLKDAPTRVDETIYVSNRTDPTVVDLAILVLHFVVFCRSTQLSTGSIHSELDRISHHYTLHRSLYPANDDDDEVLPFVKTLISLCYQ